MIVLGEKTAEGQRLVELLSTSGHGGEEAIYWDAGEMALIDKGRRLEIEGVLAASSWHLHIVDMKGGDVVTVPVDSVVKAETRQEEEKSEFILHLEDGGTLTFRSKAPHPLPTPIAELIEKLAKWIERNEQQMIEALRWDDAPTGFSDTCLVCGNDTLPHATRRGDEGRTKGLYKCKAQHPWGERAQWWTYWTSSEVDGRVIIFDTDLVGGEGATTWTILDVGTRWGDQVKDIVPELRPLRPPQDRPESLPVGGASRPDSGDTRGSRDADSHPLGRSFGRVLIVEPHSGVQEGLVRYLEAKGFSVVGTAEDGAEAIGLVGELRPDVVTTEINLPVIDGVTMAGIIREQFPKVQVLVLTTRCNEVIKQEAMAAGVTDYLVKSADAVEVLQRVIDNASRRSRGEDPGV